LKWDFDSRISWWLRWSQQLWRIWCLLMWIRQAFIVTSQHEAKLAKTFVLFSTRQRIRREGCISPICTCCQYSNSEDGCGSSFVQIKGIVTRAARFYPQWHWRWNDGRLPWGNNR
jgi:hypothetical protein